MFHNFLHRYWPVAYLHRGPPPNVTYFRYNEVKPVPEPEDTVENPPRGPQSRADDDGLNLEDSYNDGRNTHSRGNDGSRGNNYNSRNNDKSRNNGDSNRRNDDSRRNNDDSRNNDENTRRNDGNSRNNGSNNRDFDDSRRRNDGSRGNDDNFRSNDSSRRSNDDSRDDDDNFRETNSNSRSNDNSRETNNNSRKTNNNSRNNDDTRMNDKPRNGKRDEETTRDEKKINDSKTDDIFNTNVDKTTSISITTETPILKENNSDVEFIKTEDFKTKDNLKGIDDKLDDFSKSIEVLDIEDVKGEKLSDLKTLEAEERQIEAIGRLLASRRGNKLVIEKRSQKDLDAKHISIDKDVVDFNFGNRFPAERRGVIKRVSKDELDRVDKSLEVSETTFVRPPRVLSTTDNIRKAFVNGKVFYDATIRDQREIFANNSRKPKSLRRHDNTTPSIINSNNFGRKKIVRTRNTNPVRRVKRVYRKRYNPEEVRRRLLERDKGKNSTESKA